MLASLAVVWLVLPATLPPTEGCSPLQAAVVRGDQAAVRRLAGRRLLGLGAPLARLDDPGEEESDCYSRTPLMLAAEHGRLESARLLLSSGADVNATALLPELGGAGIDARCIAIAHGHAELVTTLERAGAFSLVCSDPARLLAAVRIGNEREVERLLRARPSVATLATALQWAVGKRTGRAVDLLIQAGLDARIGFEPVYEEAVLEGDLQLVRQLSSAGAKLEGGSALSRAIELRRVDAIAPLLGAGAEPEHPRARSAIFEAVRVRDDKVLTALLNAGYRPRSHTPLLLAAVRQFPGFVPALLKAGLDVESDDELGTTPLMAAAGEDDAVLVERLIRHGASPRTADLHCRTALDAARSPTRRAREALLKAMPAIEQPVIPGRAARRTGVTCGAARLWITHGPDLEIYLPNAELPILSSGEYQVDTGSCPLRVKRRSTGAEQRVRVMLAPGLNSLSERIAGLDWTRPDVP